MLGVRVSLPQLCYAQVIGIGRHGRLKIGCPNTAWEFESPSEHLPEELEVFFGQLLFGEFLQLI